MRALRVDGVDDLSSMHACSSELRSATADAARWGMGINRRTFFQAAIWASFQIPGALGIPDASGEMNVASVMRSVPGTEARCL